MTHRAAARVVGALFITATGSIILSVVLLEPRFPIRKLAPITYTVFSGTDTYFGSSPRSDDVKVSCASGWAGAAGMPDCEVERSEARTMAQVDILNALRTTFSVESTVI